ncbi:hypothetical protein NDU88_003590 [Pleurodeles waltl]|uniref:Uncharacterized protein n=1 Tax=Pleurodeles waltl TaxID=8319 RepID=A0AAV7RDB3_PLEWA|nr:hypothetical protein NDU88_003590 [Pleurodeles waltl]
MPRGRATRGPLKSSAATDLSTNGRYTSLLYHTTCLVSGEVHRGTPGPPISGPRALHHQGPLYAQIQPPSSAAALVSPIRGLGPIILKALVHRATPGPQRSPRRTPAARRPPGPPPRQHSQPPGHGTPGSPHRPNRRRPHPPTAGTSHAAPHLHSVPPRVPRTRSPGHLEAPLPGSLMLHRRPRRRRWDKHSRSRHHLGHAPQYF